MSIESDTFQTLYSERYKTDYMDSDGFAVWVRRSLGHQKVNDTLDMIPMQPRNILDYGCGAGNWLQLLSMRYRDAKLTGVDIADTAIEKCRQRFPEHQFSAFDGTRTALSSQSFDLVFSFHVLEHVARIEDSIAEISRLIAPGGYACIIFPCGNPGSFQDWVMRNLQEGIEPTSEGRFVHFFEKSDGHLRRMLSSETIELFENNGMTLIGEYYAGQFFGSMDWLCRSCVPSYIRNFFSGRPPNNARSAIQLTFVKALFIGLNAIIRKQNLDTHVKRNFLKQILVYIVKYIATGTDYLVGLLARLEWMLFKRAKNGSAQYLIFQKLS